MHRPPGVLRFVNCGVSACGAPRELTATAANVPTCSCVKTRGRAAEQRPRTTAAGPRSASPPHPRFEFPAGINVFPSQPDDRQVLTVV